MSAPQPTWHPENYPRQARAWHAIQKHLRTHRSATRHDLAHVALAGSDLLPKSCRQLIVSLCRAGYLRGLTGGTNAIYELGAR